MKRKIALALAAVMSVTSFAGFGVSANSAYITRTISNWAANRYVIGENVAEGRTDLRISGAGTSTNVANSGNGTNYEVIFDRTVASGARFNLSLDNGGAFAYGFRAANSTTGAVPLLTGLTDSNGDLIAGTTYNSNVANGRIYSATGNSLVEEWRALVGNTSTATTVTKSIIDLGGATTKIEAPEAFLFASGTAGFSYDEDIVYSPAGDITFAKQITGNDLTVANILSAIEKNMLADLGSIFANSTSSATDQTYSADTNKYFVAGNGKYIEATAEKIGEAITDGDITPSTKVYEVTTYNATWADATSAVATLDMYTVTLEPDAPIYTLYVPSTDKGKMYVSFPYGVTVSGTTTMSIPLAFQIGDTSNVTTMTVDTMDAIIPGLGTTYRLTANISGTILSVDKATGKDNIALNTITIKESGAGVFRPGNYFDLTLTDDFAFTTDGTFTGSVLGTSGTNAFVGSGKIYASEKLAREVVGLSTATNADGAYTTAWTTAWTGTDAGKSAIAYYKDSDKTAIRIWFNSSYQSTGMVASVILKGAYVGGERDHEPVSGDIVSLYVKKNSGMGSITEESKEVAEFSEYGISYIVATAKEVYSGMTGREAAKVTISENLVNSWAANRRTELTLVDKDGNTLDEVKFTYIKFADNSNISGNVANDTEVYNRGGNLITSLNAYYNEAGNVVTLNNLNIASNSRAKLSVIAYLSAAPGFVGDVYLKIGGTGVSGESVSNNAIAHIATFSEKVDIKATATSIEANATSATINEIVISELNSGALTAGNTIVLAFSKNGEATTDVRFRNVNKDNLTVDGVRASISTDNTSGEVTITIDRASSTAGSITLSNLGVVLKTGLTSGVYDLTVNGNAIAANIDVIRNADVKTPASGGAAIPAYEYTTADKRNTSTYNRDAFDTDGYVVTGYVLIGSSGEKAALDMTVVYTSGSAVVVANGESVDMGLAPVNVNGSLFVPVRYTLTPYGIDPEKNVVWDPTTSTAYISVGDTRVEFVSGSSVYRVYVNNVLTNIVEMVDANGAVVKSQIIDGRMFVPVRQFANAFGLDTNWDATSGEATFTLVK